MNLVTFTEYLRYVAFALMLLRFVIILGYGRHGSLLWTFYLPHGSLMLLVLWAAARAGGWASLAQEDWVATGAWSGVIIGQTAAVIADWWPSGLSPGERLVVPGYETP